MPEQAQYAAAAHIPLIKSPSLRVPRAVELPPDLHPLPDDVNAYFVYPFTLEPHIITLESARRSTLAAHVARREAYLLARDDEKERRKREALRKIAPGFEPSAAPLVPTPIRKSTSAPAAATNMGGDAEERPKDVMEDLVSKLEMLESSSA
ncbi:hypothetical protein OE88DRAFT_408936 [Heliocybe sulcata]|uniref:Uncharacterized protein n=1 Tax=Heliocybe sulcata TaxID=5364 RepID=A0A5C3MWR9_9AGAM|nr:hypothetical protein OE88DRAFT_408936 [Heliocybe sulcata]